MTENTNGTESDQTSLASENTENEGADWVSVSPEDYRVTSLKDDVAEVLRLNDRLDLGPVRSGGTGNTRAVIAADESEARDVADLFASAGFITSTDLESGEIQVHGRETDLTDLHSGDLVHVNDRGGPWRVTNQEIKTGFDKYGSPHAADVVYLTHADRDDVNPYAVVRWYSSDDPALYTKTVDKESGVKDNERWKKYEDVDRIARLGPARCYKVTDQNAADYLRNRLEDILDGKYSSERMAGDAEDVEREFGRDTLDEFADRLMFGTRIISREEHALAVRAANVHRRHDSTPKTIQVVPIHAGHPEFIDDVEDREDLDSSSDAGRESEDDSPEDASEGDGEDTAEYVCENCGTEFQNRFRYSKQSAMCSDPSEDYTCEGEPNDE